LEYKHVVRGTFLNRPNRFIARVLIDGQEETVHVPNTGRCKELLVAGADVVLAEGQGIKRRTRYSVIAVYKGNLLINMDSQAPNAVVYEGMQQGRIRELPPIVSARREMTWGHSRFDVHFVTEDGQSGYMEVKGVTLENNGMALFPDAPTLRGTKHVYELMDVASQGHLAVLCFLIQMSPVSCFTPNHAMDAKFATAVQAAAASGVEVIAYDSVISPSTIELGQPVAVRLLNSGISHETSL